MLGVLVLRNTEAHCLLYRGRREAGRLEQLDAVLAWLRVKLRLAPVAGALLVAVRRAFQVQVCRGRKSASSPCL